MSRGTENECRPRPNGTVADGPSVRPEEKDAQDQEPPLKPLSWPLLMRMIGLMRTDMRLYLWGAACGVLAVSLELATPTFARRIIDVGIPSGMAGEILRWALAWAGFMAAALLFESLQIGFSHQAGEGVLSDLRYAIFKKLHVLPMAYYDRTKLGRIITRGTSDIDALRPAVNSGINTLVLNGVMMAGSATMIGITDLRLLAALALLLPPLSLCNHLFRKIIAHQQQVLRAGYSRVASNLAENITGVRVVAAFNRQRQNLTRFNMLQDVNAANNLRVANTNGVYQPLLELIRFGGQAIVLGYGGALAVSGSATAGAVIAALFYWDFFMRPTINIGNFYNTLMQAMASGERIFALLDEPEQGDAADALAVHQIVGDVRFDQVTFGYDPERPVLHAVSLDAPKGSTVAIMGGTGSGKSTMILLLARFYEIQAGRIKVDGRDVRALKARSLRQRMGMVLQANYLFTGTIGDNIRYPKPSLSEEGVKEAARELGLHDTFAALPEGYRTHVGERGAAVSLGLRQLICLTRALVADPRIFLLDEATSSIDTVTEGKVQNALRRLSAHRTTIVVAHRLSTIVDADQIVVLEKGRVVERGKHEDLVATEGIYSGMYKKFATASE